MAILARLPLASGVLSGQFRSGQKFGANDHRNYNANGEKFNVGETFAGLPYEQALVFAEKVKAILQAEQNAPMAQLSLRWILDDESVSTVIPGATKLAQVESNAKASQLPRLSKEVHQALRQLYQSEIDGAVRGKY